MEKMMLLRSIIRAACFRSPRFAAISHHQLRHHLASRFIFTLWSPSFAAPSNRIPSETELGSKMMYLKMRCSGLGSEWGKVTVLATSGLAGSYIEQRAKVGKGLM